MVYLAVLRLIRDPKTAFGYLEEPAQLTRALAGAAVFILIASSVPFVLTGRVHPSFIQIPLMILLERGLVAGAAGISVYILAMAMGDKKALAPAFASCFMAMGPFVALVVLLSFVGMFAGLPEGFSWSPAELFAWMPPGRVTLFLLVFTARFDVASVVTVSLWARGLSVLWKIPFGKGLRLTWTVYLTGMILLALPVLLSTFHEEGAP